MGVRLYTNNAESTLNGNITNSQTTNIPLTVGGGSKFPTVTLASGNWFYATFIDVSGNREIIKVTEHQVSTDFFQTVVRGQDGTSGQAFVTGDKVELRLPKIVLEEIDAAIAANTALTNAQDAAMDARVDVLEANLTAPSGTKMFFYQNVAPNAWTIDSGPADSLLAVKGGSQDYNISGGAVAGSWTPTTHTHTGPSHVHTGPSHQHTTPDFTLTTSHIPAHTHGSAGSHQHAATGNHTHDLIGYRDGSGGAFAWVGDRSSTQWTDTTGIQTAGNHQHAAAGTHTHTSVGSGNAHNHGSTGAAGTDNTGASGTAATGASSAPSTDRPKAGVGIIATKD
jgi:hypothetical protein